MAISKRTTHQVGLTAKPANSILGHGCCTARPKRAYLNLVHPVLNVSYYANITRVRTEAVSTQHLNRRQYRAHYERRKASGFAKWRTLSGTTPFTARRLLPARPPASPPPRLCPLALRNFINKAELH
ncbi:hypothetical protein EVAR_36873_1 [Eumeta japonica]|uniref:Uncharacterized protein n=1 Tax=Eumeta variegata TaxID=151549 RepID=A0A4C1WT10_EUMVA|nr:hypothetical protein EVAR_36873_1 [Eumeta japonica]